MVGDGDDSDGRRRRSSAMDGGSGDWCGRQRWTAAATAKTAVSGGDNGWREQVLDGGGVCDNGDGCRRRLRTTDAAMAVGGGGAADAGWRLRMQMGEAAEEKNVTQLRF